MRYMSKRNQAVVTKDVPTGADSYWSQYRPLFSSYLSPHLNPAPAPPTSAKKRTNALSEFPSSYSKKVIKHVSPPALHGKGAMKPDWHREQAGNSYASDYRRVYNNLNNAQHINRSKVKSSHEDLVGDKMYQRQYRREEVREEFPWSYNSASVSPGKSVERVPDGGRGDLRRKPEYEARAGHRLASKFSQPNLLSLNYKAELNDRRRESRADNGQQFAKRDFGRKPYPQSKDFPGAPPKKNDPFDFMSRPSMRQEGAERQDRHYQRAAQPQNYLPRKYEEQPGSKGEAETRFDSKYEGGSKREQYVLGKRSTMREESGDGGDEVQPRFRPRLQLDEEEGVASARLKREYGQNAEARARKYQL